MEAQTEVSPCSSPLSPQPAAVPLSPRRHGDDIDDDDDGDLNKTLGVQRFQQILSPAQRLPAEQHRTFNQEDLEGKITGKNQRFLLHKATVLMTSSFFCMSLINLFSLHTFFFSLLLFFFYYKSILKL